MALDPTTTALANELVEVRRELEMLKRGQRAMQLQNASIENDGSLRMYDGDGLLRMAIGRQLNGGYAVTTPVAPTPPPRPNTPDVAGFPSGLGISWNGEFSTGTRPADFLGIEIYLGSTATFIPDSSNYVGMLNEAGGYPVAPLDTGSTYYALFIAINTAEKPEAIGTGVRASASQPSLVASGTPTAVVASEILDGIVTELSLANSAVSEAKLKAGAVTETKIAENSISSRTLIANAILGTHIAADQILAGHLTSGSVTTGKLAALAVQADKIAANAINAGHIQAGAVTAESLEAELILTSRIIAGNPRGARVEMHPTNGLQAYNAAGLRSFWINAGTGAAQFIGEIKTADTGSRIVMNPGGNNPEWIEIYPDAGTESASILAYTDTSNGAGMILQASTVPGTERVSTIVLRTNFASLGVTDYASTFGDSYFYAERNFVRARSAVVDLIMDKSITPLDGSRRIAHIYYSTSGVAEGPTRMDFLSASDGYPWLFGVGRNSGLKFHDTVIEATTGTSVNLCPMRASSFPTSSSIGTKEDVAAIALADERTSWDLIEGAPALEWYYTFEGQRPAKPTDFDGNVITSRNADGSVSEMEWAEPLPPRRKHKFPIAEDLNELDDQLSDETNAVDLRDMIGILWDAVDMLIKRTRIYEELLSSQGKVTLPPRPQKGDMIEGIGKLKPGFTKREIDPVTKQSKAVIAIRPDAH